MKKILILSLVFSCALTLTACQEKSVEDESAKIQESIEKIKNRIQENLDDAKSSIESKVDHDKSDNSNKPAESSAPAE